MTIRLVPSVSLPTPRRGAGLRDRDHASSSAPLRGALKERQCERGSIEQAHAGILAHPRLPWRRKVPRERRDMASDRLGERLLVDHAMLHECRHDFPARKGDRLNADATDELGNRVIEMLVSCGTAASPLGRCLAGPRSRARNAQARSPPWSDTHYYCWDLELPSCPNRSDRVGFQIRQMPALGCSDRWQGRGCEADGSYVGVGRPVAAIKDILKEIELDPGCNGRVSLQLLDTTRWPAPARPL